MLSRPEAPAPAVRLVSPRTPPPVQLLGRRNAAGGWVGAILPTRPAEEILTITASIQRQKLWRVIPPMNVGWPVKDRRWFFEVMTAEVWARKYGRDSDVLFLR